MFEKFEYYYLIISIGILVLYLLYKGLSILYYRNKIWLLLCLLSMALTGFFSVELLINLLLIYSALAFFIVIFLGNGAPPDYPMH